MQALVVYDSKFGNTREIALRVGRGLASKDGMRVDVLSTFEHDGLPPGLDLLVLGAPTQAHGLEATMREFLDGLPRDRLTEVQVAVFDTRMHWPRFLSGSAADGIARWVEEGSIALLVPPESFFVAGKEGPLRDGELERAEAWGRSLAAAVMPTAAGTIGRA